MLKIGIDVGGTFTDLFLWASDGHVETFKTLSTPEDPSVGVFNGLSLIADSRGVSLKELTAQIATIVHGTTVTTNATLTRKGAKTGLLTTAGVRDALEMRRGIREKQYDNRYTNVIPLVPRYLRRPLQGRLDCDGKELSALNLEEVREAVALFKAEGVESVAICLMNSFANAAHERSVAEIVQAELPEAYLSVSSELLPTVRFYNRVSTTVLNAYIGPVLERYLSALTRRLDDVDFGGVLLIMQSNGGVALPDVTIKHAATTLLSGPAAGPQAAATYMRPHGKDDCIIVDMGGTSFDAALVRGGDAAVCNEGDINRLRIALPMLEINTIGAGGGSVGWIDEGGLLRMGPESAGAMPGPACYDQGGTKPTCTDANLLLGYLDPGFFAGGRIKLDAEAARRAVKEHVADPLDMEVDEAAAGMYRVITANMAHGVREITVKRGVDPREFPVVVAGGAGALHACMIAHELEIPSLLVPSTASVLCATGMLLTDLQHDFVRSCVGTFGGLEIDRIQSLIDDMKSEGESQLKHEGIDVAEAEHQVSLDLRYLNQYHEVTLRVPADAIAKGDRKSIAESFHQEHNRLYGYDLGEEGTGLELINVRVRSTGRVDKPELPLLPEGDADASAAHKTERRAFDAEAGSFTMMPVYDGHKLKVGNVVQGPALIERVDTTLLVTSSYRATMDAHGSCRLERLEA